MQKEDLIKPFGEIANKIKAGKKLTDAEEKLCVNNFKMFSKFFSVDDLDRYFSQTKLQVGQELHDQLLRKRVYVGKKNQRDFQINNDKKTLERYFFDAAVKIKIGEKLTPAEVRVCNNHFYKFCHYLNLEDLNEYFWIFRGSDRTVSAERVRQFTINDLNQHFSMIESETGKQLNKNLFEYWKQIFIESYNLESHITSIPKPLVKVENSNSREFNLNPQSTPTLNTRPNLTHVTQKSWIDNLHSSKILIGLLLIIFGFTMAANFHSQLTPTSVSVSGYYRSDGTYIHPYNRRPPNSVEHDKPFETGMFFFGFIGVVGCIIVVTKWNSYRE